jgi:hypothetical protein
MQVELTDRDIEVIRMALAETYLRDEFCIDYMDKRRSAQAWDLDWRLLAAR